MTLTSWTALQSWPPYCGVQVINNLIFSVNGHTYPRYYLLADGIYPQWSYFFTAYSWASRWEKTIFIKMQVGARKDVERAFGCLQACWKIAKNPCRQWELETINDIMTCCIIYFTQHDHWWWSRFEFETYLWYDNWGRLNEGSFYLPWITGRNTRNWRYK